MTTARDFDPTQSRSGNHAWVGGVDTLTDTQNPPGNQKKLGVGHVLPAPPATFRPATNRLSPGEWATPIGWAAELVEDAEDNRKRIANRIRAARDDNPGHLLQWGAMLHQAQAHAEQAEKDAIKALEAAIRQSPYADYVKTTTGVAAKGLGRFIGAVGDPAWHYPNERPRTRSQLQAYCGVAGPGYQHRRGVQSNWNNKARMRLWNIAASVAKLYKRQPDAPYVVTFVEGREHYGYEFDGEAWVRVSGDMSPGENMNHALRLVMRHVLRDVWQIAYEAQQ